MKKHVTLGIMLTLLNGKRITASYLAEKYEVSKKTIYRSIETLLEAGMPISCLQGKNGGYELIQTSKINSSFFTFKELCSFISFLKSNSKCIIDEDPFPIEERLDLLENKNFALEIENQSKSLVIDTNSWGQNYSENEKTRIIKKAINETTKLLITYQNKSDLHVNERTIHPYTLVLKTNIWYVYAFCENRKSFRLFKLSRIMNLINLKDKYIKREIDILSKPWNSEFKTNLEVINLEMLCNKSCMPEIYEWLGKDIYVCDKLNKKIIKAQANFSYGLVHKIMEFGNKITILKPEKLSAALLNECNEICLNYK